MDRDEIRRLIGLAPTRPNLSEAREFYVNDMAEKAKTAVKEAKKLHKCVDELQDFWNVQHEAQTKVFDKLEAIRRLAEDLEDHELAKLVGAFCSAHVAVFDSAQKLKDQGSTLAEALLATAATLEGK